MYVAFGFSYIIYLTFFSKCLIAEGGYTQAEAGRLFMLMGWFSLLCGLIWGSVSDIIGRKGALAIVYLILLALKFTGRVPQPPNTSVYLRYGIAVGFCWLGGTYFGILAILNCSEMYKAVIMIVVCLSVFSVLLGVTVLKEAIHIKDVIGLLLGIASVVLLSLKTKTG